MRADMGMTCADSYALAELFVRWGCLCCFNHMGCCQTQASVRVLDCPLVLSLRVWHSVNIVVCTPLTENMPGPSATKPGDV